MIYLRLGKAPIRECRTTGECFSISSGVRAESISNCMHTAQWNELSHSLIMSAVQVSKPGLQPELEP
jgi:hypothetical protein